MEISWLGLDDKELVGAAVFSSLVPIQEPTSSTSRTGSVTFEMI